MCTVQCYIVQRKFFRFLSWKFWFFGGLWLFGKWRASATGYIIVNKTGPIMSRVSHWTVFTKEHHLSDSKGKVESHWLTLFFLHLVHTDSSIIAIKKLYLSSNLTLLTRTYDSKHFFSTYCKKTVNGPHIESANARGKRALLHLLAYSPVPW